VALRRHLHQVAATEFESADRRLAWQKRQIMAGRNDDGPLQSGDRTSVAGRGFAARQTEAAVGVVVLNQVLSAGRPDAVRRMRVVA
jgi:hypothetical protein